MKQDFISFLKFLKLVDGDDSLSLTSVALVIILGKLAMAPAIGFSDIGALFLVLLSYQSKKVIFQSAPKKESPVDAQLKELTEKLQEIESKVSGLSLASGFKRNV